MYDFEHDADPQAEGYGAPPLLLTAAEALRFPVELTSSLVTELVIPPRRAANDDRPVLVLRDQHHGRVLAAERRPVVRPDAVLGAVVAPPAGDVRRAEELAHRPDVVQRHPAEHHRPSHAAERTSLGSQP